MDAIEAAIETSGAIAPRVRQEDITANIADVEYVTHVSKGGQVLRWAVITTTSGFAVTGRPSVAVSPENDREDIGQAVAYENARNELWPLMGYALKEHLHTIAIARPPEPDRDVAFWPDGTQFTPHPLHAGVVPDRSLD